MSTSATSLNGVLPLTEATSLVMTSRTFMCMIGSLPAGLPSGSIAPPRAAGGKGRTALVPGPLAMLRRHGARSVAESPEGVRTFTADLERHGEAR
ncbi:hypothetical protein GCM10010116_49920 [Microbispora rosea subsp. aerata]|nr:hypothetical protein GCM10010116_49920 [Microbispora rosea subsp. aerata]GIH57998.1 hypothetical protein Mro02_49120 [Microbispora rosea subsp. aerata]GLJ81495.1 hypothetical protein GCM10017588_02190 [Microbispora rosea subsp. aerata]